MKQCRVIIVIVVFILCHMAAVYAGEDIFVPDRFSTIRPGDWFLFKANGKLVRETCFRVEGDGAKRVVYYTAELFDARGEYHHARRASISYLKRMIKLPELQAFLAAGVVPAEKIEKKIGGKDVELYRVWTDSRNKYWTEVWLTDRFSTQGVAMMTGGTADPSLEIAPVDFGNWFDDNPGAVIIPDRGEKLREGDWFLFRKNGVLKRETMVAFEKNEDDILVHYRIEEMDSGGSVVETVMEVESLMDILAQNCLENGPRRSESVIRKDTLEIAGKTIDVVVVEKEDGDTEWHAESASLFGTVKMVEYNSKGEVIYEIEPVDFGSADEN